MTLLALNPLIDGFAIPGPVVIKLIPGSLDIDLLIYDFRIGLILFKLILFTLITDFPRSWLKGSDKIISSNSTISSFFSIIISCLENKIFFFFF